MSFIYSSGREPAENVWKGENHKKKGCAVLIKLSPLRHLPAFAILSKLAVASDSLTTKPWPPLPCLSLQKDTDWSLNTTLSWKLFWRELFKTDLRKFRLEISAIAAASQVLVPGQTVPFSEGSIWEIAWKKKKWKGLMKEWQTLKADDKI